MTKKDRWASVSLGQRYAIQAARLRAEGKVVHHELLDDPQPDDLIVIADVAEMAGLTVNGIYYRRTHPAQKHPLPPHYIRKAGKYHRRQPCWQRQQITDWIDERRAVKMAPVVLNWHEIYQLRKLLRELPAFDKIGHACRDILGEALQLKGETDE